MATVCLRLQYLLASTFFLQLVGTAEKCGSRDEQMLATEEQVEKYGIRIPYNTSLFRVGIPCDDLYIQHVDYVFIPNDRGGGDPRDFIRYLDDTDIVISLIPERCRDTAVSVFCHYFLPPCGNSTVFEPPTSVCEDTCNYLRTLCPQEWEFLNKYMEDRPSVATLGFTMLNCSNTGEYLHPLTHCCQDLGIEIHDVNETSATDDQSLLQLAAGISVATVGVVTMVIVGFAVVVVVIKMCKLQNEVVTKDIALPERSEIEESIRYHAANPELRVPPPVFQQERARVASVHIRRLAGEKLLIPGRSISLMDTVGQGEFGVVYRGHLTGWRGGTEQGLVAVKTIKGVFSANELDNMIKESLKMVKFNHQNVMKLIGVCIEKGPSPYIVMPYMTYGSLLSYLKKHRAELTIANNDDIELVTASQKKLLSICLQVAKGMEYLANEQFVHRDLAARNCMIDENFVIKVADFGLSEDIYARNYFRQGSEEEGGTPVKLPVRWMAIESLNDGIFTEKTDVWSFGVTVWEVFSLGKTPYPGVDPFALIKYLDKGGRLDKPSNAACSEEIYAAVTKCWEGIPDDRPNFSELVVTFSSCLEDIAEYIDFSPDPITKELPVFGYDHLIPTQPEN